MGIARPAGREKTDDDADDDADADADADDRGHASDATHLVPQTSVARLQCLSTFLL